MKKLIFQLLIVFAMLALTGCAIFEESSQYVDERIDVIETSETIPTFTITITSDNLPSDFQAIPSLEITSSERVIENASINIVSARDRFLNSNVPGFIANAFEINIEGIFYEAILSFELNRSLFDDPYFVPVIYFWDTEMQFLFEFDHWLANLSLGLVESVQYLSGNVIKVVINRDIFDHFTSPPQFMVLNKTEMDNVRYRYHIRPF